MNKIRIFQRRLSDWDPRFACEVELLSSDNRGLKFQAEEALQEQRDLLYYVETEAGMRPIQLLPGRSPKAPFAYQARWNEPLTEV